MRKETWHIPRSSRRCVRRRFVGHPMHGFAMQRKVSFGKPTGDGPSREVSPDHILKAMAPACTTPTMSTDKIPRSPGKGTVCGP